MKHVFLLCMSVLLLVSGALAQGRKISGNVTDSKDGSPMPGVTVKVKGASSSTQSDVEGNFSITIPAGSKILNFSFVGYGDVELAATENMQVKLSASAKSLNEVVVVGYGRASRKDITGSIARIGSKDVENIPVPSFESALQGKAAGVVIESGSGKVGQGIRINIRGTSSISASSQPLYVVDGLPIVSSSLSNTGNDPTNPLIDINPNDIESVEILKDASASAIYGARAANGVVLITTKKGRNSRKTTIELNMAKGYSNPARKRKFLDAKQYVDLMHKAAANDANYDFTNGVSGFPSLDSAMNYYNDEYNGVLDYFSLGTDYTIPEVNTNWQDQMFNKNAQTNQVDLSAYGGDARTRFFVSGFYNTQEAVVINNKFYRYGGRLNLEHNASDKLTLGVNLSVDRTQLDRVSTDNAFSTPGQLVAQLPISPLIDPSTGKLNKQTLYANGLFDAQYSSNNQSTNRAIGNAFAAYTFLPDLTFRSEFGADLITLYEEAFLGKETVDGSASNGLGSFNNAQSTSFNTNNYFTYAPKINDKSKLNAVLGMSYLQNDTKKNFASGEQYPSDAVKTLAGATSITGATSSKDRYTFLSYFLRGSYSYMNRYLISASVRTDGSSRFSPDHRYGWFPSVSGGWVLSEENFLKNTEALSYLKLRASWGLTGNAEIGEYKYYSLDSVSNYPGLPGLIPNQLGNSDLRWERTSQTDIGVDFGFLKNRITGEVDLYKKHTTDLLLNVNIPATTGFTSLYRNLGTMDNKGVEVTLNSSNLVGKFKWNTSLNFAYNQNKVVNIRGQIIEDGTGLERAVEGEPIGTFFMQKFVGVDPQTGDALYQGKDGKPTSDFSLADRLPVGKSNPNWTGGFTNTFSYKGIDLSVFFTFVTGNNIYNAAGIYMSGGYYNGYDNQTSDMLNTWTKPGDVTNIPRVGYNFGSGFQNSSRFLYNGSYARLKNVTLGYSLPASVTKALHIQSARIYTTGINLWTRTDYPSDPEVNTATIDNIGNGQDLYTVPQARTITVGLNVKF
ncbi:TonB-dependent receptor [Danxiaibacter flavus]|uniref:TonB-dependent receptor n=1 Tax=Danxiaibacter flavus TaxID=3049108 RepID=A0ABV3ZMR8_9BACT|nr:TonB-dependent receptor [Chitinophagaceae bacterium DXS]